MYQQSVHQLVQKIKHPHKQSDVVSQVLCHKQARKKKQHNLHKLQ